MKNFLLFMGGFVTGIFVTLFVLFIIGIGLSASSLENEGEIQYIEITGKKGEVTVFTGMSKDSVEILVGKPDDVELQEMLNTYYEKWGYKLENNLIPDLVIEFENGELKGVRQN